MSLLSPRRLVAAGLLAAGTLSMLSGQEAAAPKPSAAAPDAEANIAQWIKQLDSDRFTERSAASQRLEATGKAACPALAEAAVGESREVTLRALEILRKHFEQGDAATKEAARQALQQIADGKHESAARRAKEVLTPAPAEEAIQPPMIQLAPQQVQIQVQIQGGGNVQRRVQIVNGVKQIEATEDGRKVKITDDPQKGIKIEVTEKRNGKEQTRTYEAKNADELKKKHPEGHELYQKYSQGQPAIQIQAVPALPGLPLPAMPLPGGAAPAAPNVPAANARQTAATMVRHAQQLVDSAVKQLERLPAAEDGESLQQSRKRLQELAKQLGEERGKLEK